MPINIQYIKSTYTMDKNENYMIKIHKITQENKWKNYSLIMQVNKKYIFNINI